MSRSIVVDYDGGEDRWADAGTFDLLGGVLAIYHVETKKILVAYGPHAWTRARWEHREDDR